MLSGALIAFIWPYATMVPVLLSWSRYIILMTKIFFVEKKVPECS